MENREMYDKNLIRITTEMVELKKRVMYDKFLIRITTEMVELKTRVFTLEQTNKMLRDALESRGQQDSTLVTPPAPQAKKPRGRPPGAKNKPKTTPSPSP